MKDSDNDPAFLNLLKQIGINKDFESALTPEVIAKATKDINKKMEQYRLESSMALGHAIYSASKTRLGPPK